MNLYDLNNKRFQRRANSYPCFRLSCNLFFYIMSILFSHGKYVLCRGKNRLGKFTFGAQSKQNKWNNGCYLRHGKVLVMAYNGRLTLYHVNDNREFFLIPCSSYLRRSFLVASPSTPSFSAKQAENDGVDGRAPFNWAHFSRPQTRQCRRPTQAPPRKPRRVVGGGGIDCPALRRL